METIMNCIVILSRSYYAYFMSTFACNGLFRLKRHYSAILIYTHLAYLIEQQLDISL